MRKKRDRREKANKTSKRETQEDKDTQLPEIITTQTERFLGEEESSAE